MSVPGGGNKRTFAEARAGGGAVAAASASFAVTTAATASVAARQASWIAALEPWRGLGYSAAALGKFLRRSAAAGQMLLATARRQGEPVGLLVLQPGFLLGDFVALLAVRPEAAGQGVGRVLMTHAEATTFTDRRWLFVSADAGNRAALGFYKKMGFVRVGRLPDLVRDGRTEILLRKGRP